MSFMIGSAIRNSRDESPRITADTRLASAPFGSTVRTMSSSNGPDVLSNRIRAPASNSVTVNDVVLAVVTSAVADFLETEGVPTADQYMRVMCPVNVRTENQKGTLGNRVSAIFPVLPAWQMPVACISGWRNSRGKRRTPEAR